MTSHNIISIKGLNHYFGENSLRKQILFSINLEIRPKEFVILTGPSGSGKSTLLSLVGCLRSVQSGSLNVLGKQLRGAKKQDLIQVRRQFGYITQSSNLLEFLTAQQNVQMSLELHSEFSASERRNRASAILDSVGLGDFINSYPDNLSGGQRQRVAIACALASRPKLILADEPTAALDRKSGRNVVALMHRLAKEHGSAVLMVTHDNRILDLADRIINVEDGKLGLAVSQELAIAFPGLNPSILEDTETQPTLLAYAAGEDIVKQGDRATKFYVLLEGKVDVLIETPEQGLKRVRQMTRGEYFGEIGLLQGGKRTATVRASQDSEAKVMVIDEALFYILLADSELTNLDIAHNLHQRIMTSHLALALPNLTSARLSEILAKVDVIRYGPNSKIIQAGDPVNKFYLIYTGKACVFKIGEHGEKQLFQTLQAGDFFGETELINSTPYPMTIQAHPDNAVDVISLNQEDFRSLVIDTNVSQDEVATVLRDRLMSQIDKTLVLD